MTKYDLLISGGLILGGLAIAAIAGLCRRGKPQLGNVGPRPDFSQDHLLGGERYER